MATGRSGARGKSVPRAVGRATGPEPEPAVTPQLSTAGSPAMAVLRIQSCAIFSRAQVREDWFRISCIRGFLEGFLFFPPKPLSLFQIIMKKLNSENFYFKIASMY